MTQSSIRVAKSKLAMIEGKAIEDITHDTGLISIIFKEGDDTYELGIMGSMRFYKDDEYIFASADRFQPIDELYNDENFVWNTFPWHVKGNNLLDVAIEKHFASNFSDYIVERIQIKKFGDLTLHFTNGYTLDTFGNASEHADHWYFGVQGAEKPLIVVAGIGLDHEMMDRG